jgi:hypothetical protein
VDARLAVIGFTIAISTQAMAILLVRPLTTFQ